MLEIKDDMIPAVPGMYSSQRGRKLDAAPTPLPCVTVESERELERELDTCIGALADRSHDAWKARHDVIRRLQALVIGGATKFPLFLDVLRNDLRDSLGKQINDPHSQISREVCRTISLMAEYLRESFEPVFESFFPLLLKNTFVSKAVVSEPAVECVMRSIEFTPAPRIIHHLEKSFSSKNGNLKGHCSDFFLFLMQQWDMSFLDPHVNEIANSLRLMVGDSNGSVRANARKAFWVFHRHWPDQADRFLEKTEPAAQRLIAKERPPAVTSSVLSKIVAPSGTGKVMMSGVGSWLSGGFTKDSAVRVPGPRRATPRKEVPVEVRVASPDVATRPPPDFSLRTAGQDILGLMQERERERNERSFFSLDLEPPTRVDDSLVPERPKRPVPFDYLRSQERKDSFQRAVARQELREESRKKKEEVDNEKQGSDAIGLRFVLRDGMEESPAQRHRRRCGEAEQLRLSLQALSPEVVGVGGLTDSAKQEKERLERLLAEIDEEERLTRPIPLEISSPKGLSGEQPVNDSPMIMVAQDMDAGRLVRVVDALEEEDRRAEVHVITLDLERSFIGDEGEEVQREEPSSDGAGAVGELIMDEFAETAIAAVGEAEDEVQAWVGDGRVALADVTVVKADDVAGRAVEDEEVQIWVPRRPVEVVDVTIVPSPVMQLTDEAPWAPREEVSLAEVTVVSDKGPVGCSQAEIEETGGWVARDFGVKLSLKGAASKPSSFEEVSPLRTRPAPLASSPGSTRPRRAVGEITPSRLLRTPLRAREDLRSTPTPSRLARSSRLADLEVSHNTEMNALKSVMALATVDDVIEVCSSHDWLRRVSAFVTLRRMFQFANRDLVPVRELSEVEEVAIAEWESTSTHWDPEVISADVDRLFEKLTKVFLRGIGDGHFRVVGEAFQALALLFDFYRDLWSEDLFVAILPSIFLKLSDSRESTFEHASDTLHIIALSFLVDALIPILLGLLDSQKNQRVLLGILEFILHILPSSEEYLSDEARLEPFFCSVVRMSSHRGGEVRRAAGAILASLYENSVFRSGFLNLSAGLDDDFMSKLISALQPAYGPRIRQEILGAVRRRTTAQ